MAKPKQKPFLLRMDADTLSALQRWADADLRSLNGQIEWLLRTSLRRAGRFRTEAAQKHPPKSV